MIKLIVVDHEDHSEVFVRDGTGCNILAYTFDDEKAARAFCTGFMCAKSVASGLIQSLMPMAYQSQKA
jgi:hypothetical protein